MLTHHVQHQLCDAARDPAGTYEGKMELGGQEMTTGSVTCFIPPHLFDQLAQTRLGLELFLWESCFWSMVVKLQELEMKEGLDKG